MLAILEYAVFAAMAIFALVLVLKTAKDILSGKSVTSRGKSTCEHCEEAATHYRPLVKVSGLDFDTFGHRKLSAQTPIYSVGVDSFGGERLCETHYRVRQRKLEEKLASIRARVGKLNAQIETELAKMEKDEKKS